MPHALIVASDRQYCPRISAQKIHESRQFVEQGYSQKHPSPLNMGNRRNPERHSICAVARKLPAGRRAAVWDIARKLMRRKKHHPFLYAVSTIEPSLENPIWRKSRRQASMAKE
jgi:hypothetical protein